MAKYRIVYTDHAHERIGLRRLSKTSIEQTIRHPDRVQKIENGETKYTKRMGSKLYQVVVKIDHQQEAIIVVSAWIRGQEDPPDYLWKFITLPFRLIRWLWRLLFSKPQKRRHY